MMNTDTVITLLIGAFDLLGLILETHVYLASFEALKRSNLEKVDKSDRKFLYADFAWNALIEFTLLVNVLILLLALFTERPIVL